MRYDPTSYKHRELLLQHADLDGDECPVDDICDSIPDILNYIRSSDDKLRHLKQENQRLAADLERALKKINNVKRQKFRMNRKK